MLDEIKIKKYCNIYGYDYKHFPEVVVVTTGIDTWKLELVDVFNREIKEYNQIIRVNHLNKAANKSKKIHFHKQRYAYDVDYVFNNIISTHDHNSSTIKRVDTINRLVAENI